MSLFDEMMGVGMDVLMGTLGGAATYTAPGGTQTALTVSKRDLGTDEEPDEGRTDRSRCLLLGSGVVVQMGGTFTLGSETWAVDEILRQRGNDFQVRAVRLEAVEVSRPGYRR